MTTKKQFCEMVGWIAAGISFLFFFSFIDQIRLNLAGKPCSVFIPIGLIVSCGVWALYAGLKEKVDKQMLFPNVVAVIIGIVTWVTIYTPMP